MFLCICVFSATELPLGICVSVYLLSKRYVGVCNVLILPLSLYVFAHLCSLSVFGHVLKLKSLFRSWLHIGGQGQRLLAGQRKQLYNRAGGKI